MSGWQKKKKKKIKNIHSLILPRQCRQLKPAIVASLPRRRSLHFPLSWSWQNKGVELLCDEQRARQGLELTTATTAGTVTATPRARIPDMTSDTCRNQWREPGATAKHVPGIVHIAQRLGPGPGREEAAPRWMPATILINRGVKAANATLRALELALTSWEF